MRLPKAARYGNESAVATPDSNEEHAATRLPKIALPGSEPPVIPPPLPVARKAAGLNPAVIVAICLGAVALFWAVGLLGSKILAQGGGSGTRESKSEPGLTYE